MARNFGINGGHIAPKGPLPTKFPSGGSSVRRPAPVVMQSRAEQQLERSFREFWNGPTQDNARDPVWPIYVIMAAVLATIAVGIFA